MVLSCHFSSPDQIVEEPPASIEHHDALIIYIEEMSWMV